MYKRLYGIIGVFITVVSYAQTTDTLKKKTEDIAMDFNLNAAVIKADMPVVKSKNGALIYTIPKILKESTATNALDILKEVPGITANAGRIELIGSPSLKIIINGKMSTMTLEQLSMLLKSTPASRVENVEIMYVAPAKYNFNGSVINVVLSRPKENNSKLMGESGLEYGQYKYPRGRVYTNLQYANKGLNVDFLLNINGTKTYSGEDMFAIHHYKGKAISIDQTQRRTSKGYGLTGRIGADYVFSDKSSLSLAYYYNPTNNKSSGEARTLFEGAGTVRNKSRTDLEGETDLHDISLQYERKNGFLAGLSYTYYNGDNSLNYLNRDEKEILTKLYNPTLQTVNKTQVYVSNNKKIKKWSLDYGLNGSYNSSHNRGEYYYHNAPQNNYVDNMKQKEYTGNVYFETSGDIKEKFTLRIGIKGEYYYANNSNAGTLWSKWAIYPTFLLNYKPNKNNILQFSISSNVTYPGYWDLSTQKVPLNAYSYVIGNPDLMPYRTYTARLMYILRSRYIITGFYNYSPDFFTQMPYQKEDELVTIFEIVNFNYQTSFGISLIAPFKAGRVWDAKVNMTGLRQHQKCDKFNSINFDRTSLVGMIHMNNTFKIPSVKSLSLSVNGSFTSSGVIQGLYDLGYFYTISSALKYTFLKDQAVFTLSVNDIFRSSLPNNIEVNTAGQYSLMKKINETQCVKLSFSYRFGKYKKKEYKEVDKSRF